MIEWESKYDVGVEKFNAQHRNFFGILSKLTHDAQKGEEAVRESIDGLLNFVTDHFHEEESLMRELDYSGYEEHMKDHEKLMQKTQKLYSDMDMGRPASVEQVRDILVEWILEHIGTVDQKYVDFFRERGIK